MNWYTWPTEQAFNQWHDAVITGLNLPRIGHNAATGQPAPDKQTTTAYTTITEIAADDWRAPVDPDIALAYPDNLGTPSTPPPTPEEL